MMTKALIICAGGMSSSLIARKTQSLLAEQGIEVEMNAVGVPEGAKRIAAAEYDLYLVSPQTKMHFKQFSEAAKKVGKAIVQIPPQAYIPIPMGIEKMAALVKENI
ncbi:PTS cellobiose transporter subunit IIB [Streptococcus pseudoporcinus]|nr:PTS cellobiose transporter subunit IIB [Streptococcus pseudoporcinus]